MHSSRYFKKLALEGLRGKWIHPIVVGTVIAILWSAINFFFINTISETLQMLTSLALLVTLIGSDDPSMDILLLGFLLSHFSGKAWEESFTNILHSMCIALAGLTFAAICFWSLVQPGYQYMVLKLCRGEKASFKDIFYPLFHRFYRFLIIALLKFLLVFVAIIIYILFIASAPNPLILGVIRPEFSFIIVVPVFCGIAMAPLLLLEDTSLKTFQALSLSWTMMRKNKGRYFLLHLSFIGWMGLLYSLGYIRGFLTTIGWIFLAPYLCASTLYFYLDLQNRIEEAIPVSKKEEEEEGEALHEKQYIDSEDRFS